MLILTPCIGMQDFKIKQLLADYLLYGRLA